LSQGTTQGSLACLICSTNIILEGCGCGSEFEAPAAVVVRSVASQGELPRLRVVNESAHCIVECDAISYSQVILGDLLILEIIIPRRLIGVPIA
jgi:hypothetical protein